MDACPAVGIDLGTTNSCVAIFRNGKVDVIENDQGPRTTPSCVTFTDDGQVLTGLESVYESHKYLKTTVFEAKRLMGQRFSNPKVQADIGRFPYEVFDDFGTPKIRIVSNRKYEPDEFSGCILREMQTYEENQAKGLTSAVVAVPVDFNEARRQTTKDNVATAGFKNIAVIDEHTAAAIAVAHANTKETKRNLVVYDFGKRSFHASVLSVENAKCVVRGTNGDCHLGGADIDKNMVEFLKQSLEEDYDNTMDDNNTKFRRLTNICEAAKKTLCIKDPVYIELDGFWDNEFRTIPLTRARFEEINRQLFERTIKILDSCLTASGVTKSDIDEVMLVGGSSRIPKIKDMLKDYFGKEIIQSRIKPDEAIARGAAIHAANLPGNEDKMDTHLAVGIDLGKPCVAIYRTGKVDEFWITFTTSGFKSLGKILEYLNPRTFEEVMLMCQRLSDPQLQADVEKIINEDICIYGTLKITTVRTREYYPEEISAYILSKMRAHAEKRVKGVTKAVVTVPAYFNESQRKATKDAAAIAGFKNLILINEPTAAAIAFIHENQKDDNRNLLVYDFGGGTFDVSVVSVDKTNCTVRATNGDCHLGGTDIDMNMVRFMKQTLGLDDNKAVEVDYYQLRRLKNKCEAAKKKLSSEFHVDIELDSISNIDFPTIPLSRARFEQMNSGLFERTITILDRCLTDSGIAKSDIHEVILVGGSSRIPKIKDMLIEYFGKDIINNAVNPDEAVAYGAAIYAANLPGNKIEVVDVTALSLGTNTYGDCLSVIIPRNTPIPTQAIKRYQTIMDNQTLMEFPIYQGEREIASENFELGNFTMTDLTEAPAKAVKVEVCYNIDYEGLLHITATEINSGKTKALTIDMEKKGLSQQQIEERIKDAERNRENDIKRRKFQEDRYYLENLLGKVKKHAEKCSVEDKKILDGKYDSIYKWLDKAQIGELETIEEYKNELEALIAKTRLKNS